MTYSDFERKLLATYFSVVDGHDHADIYLVHNLPAEVAATLNGVYSRSSKSMRDQFLDRLRQGIDLGRVAFSGPRLFQLHEFGGQIQHDACLRFIGMVARVFE